MALSAVVDVCVGLPELVQHREGQRERLARQWKGQALVHPRLAEVTVHREALKRRKADVGGKSEFEDEAKNGSR